MKRFEIMEKNYLSKVLLKMAGEGDASPTSPSPGSVPALRLLKPDSSSLKTQKNSLTKNLKPMV